MTQTVKVGDCLHVLNHRIYRQKPSPRYHHGTPPYTDSEVHSIRRLLGHGTKRNRRYAVRVPPVPHNSLLGFNNGGFGGQYNNDDGDDDDGGGDDGEEGLFDTSIFHDDTDPNGFKLPSVFAGASPPGGSRVLNKRHDRVIPTVSERTFIDSNLRQKGYYTDRHDSSGSNGHYSNSNSNHYNNHHSPPHNAAATTSSSVTSLPPLHPHQRDLVSMKMDNGDNDYYNDNGDDDDFNKDKFRRRRKSRQGVYRDGEEEDGDGVDGTSSMFRMMSLESELTRAGSLLMDENFVPMSVTITKLAQEEDDNDDTSLDINSRHQQDAVSASLTGTSKDKTRNSKSKSTGNDSGNNKSDSKYCTCKDPRPLLIPSTSPCPCCLRTGGHHETGCPGSKGPRDSKGRQAVEATLACNLCGKPIRNNRKQRKEKGGGNGKRSKGVTPTTNREASGSGHTRNPMTPETAIHRFPGGSADFHHSKRLGCSSGSLSGNTRGDPERTSSKNRNVDPSSTTTTPNDQPRVRFDEKVMTRHIYPDGDNDGEIDDTNETRLSENNDVENSSSSKKSKNKKLFVKRRNLNNSQIGQSVNIPNLGVSVHAMAYDLALKDAQIMASGRKNGRRSQGTQPGDISNGTVFSYFPLLKRPLSENDKRDIGIKAHEVRKVKAKNYMKHIFGKVKIADYYPGGKKWRED